MSVTVTNLGRTVRACSTSPAQLLCALNPHARSRPVLSCPITLSVLLPIDPVEPRTTTRVGFSPGPINPSHSSTQRPRSHADRGFVFDRPERTGGRPTTPAPHERPIAL